MKIKDKVTFNLQSYELTSYWDTPFGVVYLYTFKDFFNNTFIWKTSRFIENNIERVSGTIKNFVEYNGQKEIELYYCKTYTV